MNNLIKSKKELSFYIMADRMMNRGYFRRSLLRIIYELFIPDVFMNYLEVMRKLQYYTPSCSSVSISNYFDNAKTFIREVRLLYYKKRFIQYKLGYSIGPYCFGYGLTIHHHGTITIGGNNRIGNYALINTSTCIIRNGSIIGNGLFMGAGAKIIKKVSLGDNVYIGANSVVNMSYDESNILIAGLPCKKIKKVDGAWYDSLYGGFWKERRDKVESLKEKMFQCNNRRSMRMW